MIDNRDGYAALLIEKGAGSGGFLLKNKAARNIATVSRIYYNSIILLERQGYYA